MTDPGAPTTTTRRPLHREPGLVLTAVLLAYSALVFTWWPTDTMVGGVSLVTWLMLVGIIGWVMIGFVYCWWTERLDRATRVSR
jgi:hypothetical protein